MAPDKIASLLDREAHIAVRSGLHCAPWAHRTIGTLDTGAVRMSIGYSTTTADVDRAIAVLAELLG
jgi:selenocysteine lyase/cysteine desulfurase